MDATHRWTIVGLAALMALPAQAQQPPDTFEIERAWVDEDTRYEPFAVEGFRSLRDALREGIVQPQTRLLVVDGTARPFALVVDQMAYHHVAQGHRMGEPWMVSF